MTELQEVIKKFTARFKPGHCAPVELRDFDRDPRLRYRGVGSAAELWRQRHLEECAECQYWESQRAIEADAFPNK